MVKVFTKSFLFYTFSETDESSPVQSSPVHSSPGNAVQYFDIFLHRAL